MATDVDVQFYSHLNGLTLSNNWGDLIRLLDKTLVTGVDFTQITSVTMNDQGDVIINLYAAHNAMLFQIVELSGFLPVSLNQKYRIKGVPDAKKLILKPAIDIAERSINTVGSGKLAPLGYDIIFRDPGDVKRVYRAKNPRTQHPFIRVDESLTSDTGAYASTYANYAMVGLLEHMDHIDDYQNPSVLQLPYNPMDPAKNWKITGTETNVVRGWSRWYWARLTQVMEPGTDSRETHAQNRQFTLCGNGDAFYLLKNDYHYNGYPSNKKYLSGCGIFDSSQGENDWFLMSYLTSKTAGNSEYQDQMTAGTPMVMSRDAGKFLLTKVTSSASSHTYANPIVPDYSTGFSDIYSGANVAALQIPFVDDDKKLRGSLKHIFYSGKKHNVVDTTVLISDNSMYVLDNICANSSGNVGCMYLYLGELE